MYWKHFDKPDISICPEDFCFNWINKGEYISERLYNDINDALGNLKISDKPRCGWTLGVCKRMNTVSDSDFFEPNDSIHRRCQLPLFYFVELSQLIEEDKDKYNDYFRNDLFKHVEVRLKFIEKFSVEKLKNSIISTMIVFENDKAIDNWSVVIEINDILVKENTATGYMRFLVSEAPHEILNNPRNFKLIGVNKLINGEII